MMRRKKMAAAMAALMMAAAMPQMAWSLPGTVHAAEAQAEKGFEFVKGKTRVVLNQEAGPALKGLGKEKRVFEQDSCAYQGKDRVYTYDDFELTTYTVNGKELIGSIYLLSGNVQTEEGVKIGSSYHDMVDAYGKGYQSENEVYRYTKNGTELAFYLTNQKVDAIEYTAIVK